MKITKKAIQALATQSVKDQYANRELGGQKHCAIFEDAPEGSELPMSMYHITNFNTKRECLNWLDARAKYQDMMSYRVGG